MIDIAHIICSHYLPTFFFQKGIRFDMWSKTEQNLPCENWYPGEKYVITFFLSVKRAKLFGNGELVFKIKISCL